MKKLMMIAALMVAALSANAQNGVGQITLKPMVGLNLASVTGDVVGNTSKKLRVGLAAGVEGEYGITDNFVSKEEYNHLKDERDEYRSISLELAATVKVLREQLNAKGGVVNE